MINIICIALSYSKKNVMIFHSLLSIWPSCSNLFLSKCYVQIHLQDPAQALSPIIIFFPIIPNCQIFITL